MSTKRIITRSIIGPIPLDNYIENKISLEPDNTDFYMNKKKEILEKYPNIYELVETKETYEIEGGKNLIKTRLDITCRVKDIANLEYRPYNNYKREPVKNDYQLEKSKYVPGNRGRFIK